MKKFLLATLLTLSTSCFAMLSEGLTGQFFVEGNWLYLKPTIDDPYFVESIVLDENFNPINGKMIKNSPHFTSAYRVGAGFTFYNGSTDIAFEWTELRESYSRSVDGLSRPLIEPGSTLLQSNSLSIFANSDSHLHYYSLNAVLDQHLWNWGYLDLIGFFGLHYGATLVKDSYLFIDSFDPTVVATAGYHRSFRGLGPEFGMGLNIDLPYCFSITGQVSTAFLLSRSHFNADAHNIFNQRYLLSEPIWRFVPYGDLRLALH